MATYEVNNLTFSRDGDTYLIKIASKEVYYGISNTADSDQQKVVTINNLEKIGIGTQISITFSNAQTYNGKPTLKINNLAAATINNGFVNMWQAGETVNFVYDGANWLYIGSGVASTNKYGVTKLTNAVTSSTTTAITPAAVNELSEYLEDAIAQNVRGATSSANGAAGRVPAPAAGDQNKYLKGDGTWKTLSTDTEFSDLAAQVTAINTEKARLIYLAAEDITWDAIWPKINVLNNTETALFTCESTACDFLTNGIRSNKLYGTISRRNDTDFKLMCRLNGNEMILADITGATSYLRPNYSERHIANDIDLTSADTTWENILNKLNVMDVGRSALFRSWATSSNVWTNGKRYNTMFGIVSRRSDTIFVFTYRLNENKLYVGSLNITDSSNPAYTEEEVIFASQIKNDLSTTAAGYVLDASRGKALNDMISQRVIGQRIYKTMAAGVTSCTLTAPSGCCCFIVASMTGMSRVWAGIIYTASDGEVSIYSLTSQANISATSTKVNQLTFTWKSLTDSHSFSLVCIPYRGTAIPAFPIT